MCLGMECGRGKDMEAERYVMGWGRVNGAIQLEEFR